MKIEVLAVFDLDNKIFGPLTQDRTKLDLIFSISRMIIKADGIRDVFIKEWKFLEAEKNGG